MKNTFLTIVAMATINTFAQVGVPNLSQAPMLMHPSMVGSNGGKRIAVVYGNGTYSVNNNQFKGQIRHDNAKDIYYFPQPDRDSRIQLFSWYQKSNFLISYDQLSKKLGSGLGGYFNYSIVPKQASAFNEYQSTFSSFLQYNANIGLSFAPKYIIMGKEDPSRIKYTWSPSISLNYQFFNAKESLLISDGNKAELTPIDYLKKEKVQSFDLNVGGLLNSSSWILGGTVGYGFDKLNNHHHLKRLGTDNQINSTDFVHHVRVSGCVAQSFPRREKSLLNFTPKLKLNFAFPFGKQPFDYSPYNGNATNICLDFRAWNILFGFSTIGGNYNSHSSIYLGYKTQNWKAILGINPFPKSSTLSTYAVSKNYSRLLELSFSYQIK